MSTNPSKINISGSTLLKVLFLYISLTVSFNINAQYNSLCWRISGNGVKKPSYLFGTMHVTDKRVFHFNDKTVKAFDDAKTYAMELDPKKAMSPTLLLKMMMKDGMTISKLISDSDYHFTDSLINKTMGVSLVFFDKMEPIIVTAMLEEFGMDMDKSDTGSMEQAMDLYFYKKAQKEKKKLIGIESVEEQIDALHQLSYQEQAQLLIETIQDIKKGDTNDGKNLFNYYINQQLDSLLAMSDEQQMPPKFYKALITDRNVRMADRIADFIMKQNAFIAVGALHLPGDGGVIALLRKKGFVVEAWK